MRPAVTSERLRSPPAKKITAHLDNKRTAIPGRLTQGVPRRRRIGLTARDYDGLETGSTLDVGSAETVGYASEIKPLFRQRDHDSMSFAFDLWSYDDVSRHADAILARLRAGTMPCDGAWPQAQVDLFARWIDDGKPA